MSHSSLVYFYASKEAMQSELIDLLKKSGYSVHEYQERLVIKYEDATFIEFEYLSVVLGVITLAVAASFSSWKISLLGIILVGVPFTSQRWQLPRQIIFENATGHLQIISHFNRKTFSNLDQPELIVEYYRKSTFVSPFQEGYQDHHYNFQALVKGSRNNLLRIKNRGRIDEQVKLLFAEMGKQRFFG